MHLRSCKHFLTAVVVIVGLTGLTMFPGCKQDADTDKPQYVFKFGHLANEAHVWHQSALKFAELVHAQSQGRIEIKVYPNEQLGKELDMINGLRAGTVDMTISGESLQTIICIS